MDRHSGLGGPELCLLKTTAETSSGPTDARCSLPGADPCFELGVQGLELLSSSGPVDRACCVLSTLDSLCEDLGPGRGGGGRRAKALKGGSLKVLTLELPRVTVLWGRRLFGGWGWCQPLAPRPRSPLAFVAWGLGHGGQRHPQPPPRPRGLSLPSLVHRL